MDVNGWDVLCNLEKNHLGLCSPFEANHHVDGWTPPFPEESSLRQENAILKEKLRETEDKLNLLSDGDINFEIFAKYKRSHIRSEMIGGAMESVADSWYEVENKYDLPDDSPGECIERLLKELRERDATRTS